MADVSAVATGTRIKTYRICDGVTVLFMTFVLFSTCCSLICNKSCVVAAHGSGTRDCGNVTLTGEAGVRLLDVLKDCRVIEGHLRIQLLTLLPNASLPNLIQITDYLLIHHVSGLTSLGDLFPNLSVVRGQHLFRGTALAVIANPHLQDVSTFKLKRILKGSVRIQENILLCTGSQRIWNKKLSDGFGSVIQDNANLCPFDDCLENLSCYRTDIERVDLGLVGHDSGHCGKGCLGGCEFRNGRHICLACEEFEKKGTCMASCPHEELVYMNYLCVKKDECRANFKGFFLSKRSVWDFDKCVKTCPPEYKVDMKRENDLPACVEKKDNEVCLSTVISAHDFGDHLQNCTVINGSLTVAAVSGKNVYQRLVRNLGRLQKISGYLKVVGANTLVSLDFLQSLEMIEGQTRLLRSQDHPGYSVYILDNSNLENLWDFSIRSVPLKIKGSVFIRFNDHLCPKLIEDFQKTTQLDSVDITSGDNGLKTQCHHVKSFMSVEPGNRFGTVVVSWHHIHCSADDRYTLGYKIYYKEAPRNVSIYEGRDACNDESIWKKSFYDFAGHPPKSGNCLHHEIGGLLPNTRYAFYVRSVAIGRENVTVITDVVYATPRAPDPVPPLEGSVSFSESVLKLEWKQPPLVFGKKIAFYDINISIMKLPSITKDPDDVEISCETFEDDIKILSELFAEKRTASRSYIAAPDAKKELSECMCTLEPRRLSEFYERKFQLQNEIYDATILPQKKDIDQQHTCKLPKMDLSAMETKHCYDNLLECPPVNWLSKEPSDFTFSDSAWKVTDWTVIGENKKKEDFSSSTSLEVALPSSYDKVSPVKMSVRSCYELEHQRAQCSPFYSWTYIPDVKYAVTNFEIENVGLLEDKSKLNFVSKGNVSEDHSETSDQPLLKMSWQPPLGIFMNEILGYRLDVLEIHANGKVNSKSVCLWNIDNKEIVYNFSGHVAQAYNVSLSLRTIAGYVTKETRAVEGIVMSGRTNLWMVGFVFIGLAAAGLLSVIIFFGRLLWEQRNKSPSVTQNDNYGVTRLKNLRPEFHLNYHDLELQTDEGALLGKGLFGRVYKGSFMLPCGSKITVAVKTIKDDSSTETPGPYVRADKIDSLLKEAVNMQNINCSFVVRLIGVVDDIICPVLSNEPSLYVVMEFMEGGDLKTFLTNPNTDPLEEKVMIEMAVQIAAGMDYLAHRNIIHRDLAARNCMLDSSFRVKVGDFGHTRYLETDYYVCSITKPTLLPVRWMAPESLRNEKSTSKSDVWSFGVLLWEIATKGCYPYEDYDNQDVRDRVAAGTLWLRPPMENSEFLSAIMTTCWRKKPRDRHSFHQLVEILLSRTSLEFKSWFDKQKNGHGSVCGETDSTEANDEGIVASCSLDDSQEDVEPNLSFPPSLTPSFPPSDPSSLPSCDDEYSCPSPEEGYTKTCHSLSCIPGSLTSTNTPNKFRSNFKDSYSHLN